MLSTIGRLVTRPGGATRADLSVAAYCLAYGADPEGSGEAGSESPDGG